MGLNLGVPKRFCSKYGSLSGGDCPLELDFCAKPLEIPVNHCDRQLPAAVSIRDRAVSRVKLTIDFSFIPLLSVTDISETEIISFGPEERDGVGTFPSSQHVARAAFCRWRSATTQCSTRIRSPVSRSGQRAMSPALCYLYRLVLPPII
jgi:hypothetical protein